MKGSSCSAALRAFGDHPVLAHRLPFQQRALAAKCSCGGKKESHCHLQIVQLSASSGLSWGCLWGLWDSSSQMNICVSLAGPELLLLP